MCTPSTTRTQPMHAGGQRLGRSRRKLAAKVPDQKEHDQRRAHGERAIRLATKTAPGEIAARSG